MTHDWWPRVSAQHPARGGLAPGGRICGQGDSHEWCWTSSQAWRFGQGDAPSAPEGLLGDTWPEEPAQLGQTPATAPGSRGGSPPRGIKPPRRGFAGIAALGNAGEGGKTLRGGWGSSGEGTQHREVPEQDGDSLLGFDFVGSRFVSLLSPRRLLQLPLPTLPLQPLPLLLRPPLLLQPPVFLVFLPGDTPRAVGLTLGALRNPPALPLSGCPGAEQ